MKNELVNTSENKEVLEVAVNKLDGKEIVELVEIAIGAALFGTMIVCLTGSEVSINNGMFKMTGNKQYAKKLTSY